MRNKIAIIRAVILICICAIQACNPPWQDHYSNQEAHIDMELWDAIKAEPRYSTFVTKMQENGLDTIFNDGQVYTLFVPDNEAFASVVDTGNFMQSILKYHVIQTMFLDRNVQNWRRLLTIFGKYSLIEVVESEYKYDGIKIEYSSPLFLNGKYYELAEVAIPKPSLYEFAAQKSSTLKEYIDSKDFIYLDRQLSIPIGFTDDGETIYDSIFGLINTFEEEYFPISKEFRDENATFVIFSQEQYIAALDDMASRLGGNITVHSDIPKVWQDNVFLPAFTAQAMFPGILSYSDLEKGTIQSITGDSVLINAEVIDPESRTVCSNGVAFLYKDFSIHDDLFRGTVLQEGEDLIESVGAGKYAWKEGIVTSGAIVAPVLDSTENASEGYLTTLSFSRDYTGEYSMEFTFKNLFPMRYRLEWRANYRPSGIYEVYVNDQILEYQDQFGNVYTQFDTNLLRSSVVSVTGERFPPIGGFNKRDYWVENLTDYGDVRVRFNYVGPGENSTNGFNIDYIKLIPDF